MGYIGVPLSYKYTKAEQVELVLQWVSRGLNGKILDHAVVNSVVYAAVEQPEKGVFAAVIPFELARRNGGWELLYNAMGESVGPCEAKCPARILNMLSPASHEFSIGWRERCKANRGRRI